MNLTAKEIAEIIDGEVVGDSNIKINSVAKIEKGSKGDLCFLSNPKYTSYIYSCRASVIIINNSLNLEKNVKSTLIKVDDAYSSFSKLLDLYNKIKFNKSGISKKSEVSSKAKIGKNVYIGPFNIISKNVIIEDNVKIIGNCFIGENVVIKKNTIIYSSVNIYHNCLIGENNIIHSGVVIGSDGFGFAPDHKSNYSKISQIGNVIIKNNVEIGANTSIDRATMGSTIINNGVKLDNLIQIAHNVEIGEHTVIAAQVAIAGSTKVGEKCMIGGQTAIAGHLTIANNVKIAGQSGVASNIKTDGEILQGPLAYNIKKYQKSYVIFKKLPEIYNLFLKLKK